MENYIVDRIALFLLVSLIILAACGGASSEAAIATGVAATLEAQVVQTAIVATQRALDTPTPEPEVLCFNEAEEYLDFLSDWLVRWEDTVEIASSTSRIALAGPVGELQGLRREIGDLEGPACAKLAGVALYGHADGTINAFLLFMQEESDDEVGAAFDEAIGWLETYRDTVDSIAQETVKATRQAQEATREAGVTPTETD